MDIGKDQPAPRRLENVSEIVVNRIGNQLESSIANEIILARDQPYLYLFPPHVRPSVTIPQLSDWDKFVRTMSQPTQRGIEVYLKNEPHSWLRIDTDPRSLAAGNWHCGVIYRNGQHLPIEIDKKDSVFTLSNKKFQYGEAEYLELLNFFTIAFAGAPDTEETREENLQMHNFSRFKDRYELTEFLEKPEETFALHGTGTAYAVPQRLMTKDEGIEYVDVASETLRKQVKDRSNIVIGKPGYGDYQSVTASFQERFVDNEINPHGVTLFFQYLNSNGEPNGITSQHVPIAVQGNDNTIGWTIYESNTYPTPHKPQAFFKHGNYDMESLKRAL